MLDEQLNSLLIDIRNGFYDEALDTINNTIQRRRNYLAADLFDEIHIGEQLRFNSKVRPQYLRGKLVEVTGKKNKNLVVKLIDGPSGRFRGDNITCPPDLLERI